MPQENIFVSADQAQAPSIGTPVTPNEKPPPIIPPPPRHNLSNFFSRIPKVFLWIVAIALGLFMIFLAINSFSRTKTGSSTITWWGLWEDQSVITPLIAAYQDKHPGVKIEYIRQSQQDYRERLTSALAKGSGPDIFAFHNSWVPMFKGDLDNIPASVINPADFSKMFFPVASSDLTSGSGIVGVPLMYDALALYINEDIFNKAGKTPPTTWDDLRILARELTVKDDQGIITQSGVALGRTENVDHWPEILALLMIQNGVDMADPTGIAAEGALTFYTLFSTSDGVWDATLPSSTQAFAAGKLAMYFAPSWRAFEIEQQNPALKFKTVPIPQLPKDSPNQADITYASYWVQGVSQRSANKMTSWDFLKFLSSEDSLQKLFTAESAQRKFGEPYPRIDMVNLLAGHPILDSIMSQAPGAQSWYLYSRTFDGPTGINSQMVNYFGDAVNGMVDAGITAAKALETAASGVHQVLSQYRLSK